MYYFREVIKPEVIDNGEKVKVPVYCKIQKDGNQFKNLDIYEMLKVSLLHHF